MIEWWGPILYEYYAGTEVNGFTFIDSEDWLAHPGSVGRPLVGDHPHLRRRRAPSCPTGEPGLIYFERDAQAVRVPQRPREDPRPPSTPSTRMWTDARRRRLRRRGGLPLPHRPQGVHDHLRRREHLPAGDRGLPGHAPQVADVAVFGVPNEDMGEEVKAVVAAGAGRRAPTPELAPELHRLRPRAPRPLQGAPLDRLPRRAAPPAHRQALQAAAARRVLGRQDQPDRLTQRSTRLTTPGDAAPRRTARSADQRAGRALVAAEAVRGARRPGAPPARC